MIRGRIMFLLMALLLTGGMARAQVTINGNVYGGCFKGKVKNPSEGGYCNTNVTINDGTVDGSVYGGGSGSLDNASDGLVEGNTYVTMNAGQVKKNVYGGGMFGSVGTGSLDVNGCVSNKNVGVTHVTVSGGVVGPFTGANANVYGGSQGKVDASDTSLYKTYANVDSTSVIINGTALVRGMVLGGGENGHVLAGTLVQIGGETGTPTIGIVGSIARKSGHVFGGGQGTSGSFTAGRVAGNTKVVMMGGTVLGCVYGGGVIARTGTDVNGNFAFVTGTGVEKVYDSLHHGLTSVVVSGGTIGDNSHNGLDLLRNSYNSGNVYGGGRGDLDDFVEDDWGRSANAIVNISGSPLIYGSVYGGGQMANVGDWNNYSDWYTLKTSTTKVIIEGTPTIGTALEFDHDNYAALDPPTYTKYETLNGVKRILYTRTGNVFGGGQGNVIIQNINGVDKVVGLEHGHCGTAVVFIESGSTPIIRSSVYGGSEQGAVWGNTKVSIAGGTIGTTDITSDKWNESTWEEGPTYSFGHVFGGSYGKDIFRDLNYNGNDQTIIDQVNLLVGRVYGNTQVDITGGRICGNVYGGGDMASVYNELNDGTITEGTCTVNVSGTSTVIGPDDGTGLNAYVFGGGKGFSNDPDEKRKAHSNVNNTKVTIDDGVKIYACVFGGSADGHVLGNTEVEIKGAGTTIGSNSNSLNNGNVFGGGGNMLLVNNTAGRVGGTTKVTMYEGTTANATATVKGNIYGGGFAGLVGANVEGQAFTDGGRGDAFVYMRGGTVEGSVYGGGTGNLDYEKAAQVLGNTNVYMTGGTVARSIYGGGELGSVGTFSTTTYTYPDTYPINGVDTEHPHHGKTVIMPTGCTEGTGQAKVIVSGGTVGVDGSLMPWTDHNPDDDDRGWIFCGGCGEADSITYPKAIAMGVVGSTLLEIKNTNTTVPLITASVYGGCENGLVLGNTHVKIMGGQIGTGLISKALNGSGVMVGSFDGVYSEDDWNTAIAAAKDGSIGTKLASGGSLYNVFHECDAWSYGYDHDGNPSTPVVFKAYDIYAERTSHPHYDASLSDKNTSSSLTGSTGSSFFGNVFGGGSGFYPIAPGVWRRTAGQVNGNTLVEITGGHILTSVYGGNEQTDIKGKCTVEMSGGTIGVPRTIDQIVAHPVTCYLFGAGKGDQRVLFNQWTNVGSVEVNITGGHIFGSVFGGGEDGHVIGDVNLSISDPVEMDDDPVNPQPLAEQVHPFIGTQGLSYVDGNVFGGGRGFSGEALTAGAVCGNVEVNISGGTMLGSIYGGGRLASVGTYLVPTNSSYYGRMQPFDPDHPTRSPHEVDATEDLKHGHIHVNISGNCTIGTKRPYIYVRAEVNPDDITDTNFATLLNKTTGDLRMMTYDTVRIKAGKQTHADFPNILSHTVSGNVFGGCMGRITKLDGTVSPIWPDLARCKKTRVTVSGDAVIRSSVYGGGELGTVLDSTTVNILGGTIGTEIVPATTTLKNQLKQYSNPNNFRYFYSLKDNTFKKKMDASGNLILDENDKPIWEFPEDSVRAILSLDTFFYRHVPSSYQDEADPHYHFGSVYGGGYGSRDRKAETDLTPDYSLELTNAPQRLAPVDVAGRVYGNTYVNVRGGQILENVYGGGDMASVGTNVYNDSHQITGTKENSGICTVRIYNDTNVTTGVITGPSIGPLDFTGLNGNVYAAGKGIGNDPDREHQPNLAQGDKHDEYYKQYCNVDSTKLTVSGGHIWGSAFGGGSDCHVLGNTGIFIREGALIGDLGITEFDGYVFGGGRNYQNLNKTSGRVQGNTYVNVTGGRIMCSIIGGGALSRVGVDVDGKIYGGISGQTTFNDSADHGNTVVSVSGNTATLTNAGTLTAPKLSSADSLLYKNYIGTTTYDAVNNNIILYKTAIGTGFGPYLLDCDYSIGDIFGGGKGDTRDTLDVTAGRVLNTYIKITDSPRIMADIYAGGEMGCIGWYDISGLNANKYYDHTGYTHLDVSGTPLLGTHYEFSIINFRAGVTWSIIDTSTGASERLLHTCSGNIYGGGQGFVCDGYSNWVSMGRVRQTHVTINGVNMMGHVFGGGSRGVVTEDTWVKVKGGIIGTVIQDEHSGVLEGHNLPEYYYGSVFGGGYGNPHHDVFETVPDSAVGGDPCVAVGYAGRVYGNTHVDITGGQIMECVFGGGDLASVGFVKSDGSLSNSVCNVTISGNAIIGPLDMTGENAYVYGGGRGRASDPTEYYRKYCNVNNTNVFVNGGKIWGSTFGGASDAHVLGDVRTTVETGADIGTHGVTSYDGNIFGGGRNYLNSNHTNGRVGGNIYVTMGGGSIKGSIFGGGRLAMSGVDSNGHYAYTTDADVEKHGNVFITVRGNAFIGTNQSDSLLFADESVGDIFGSGKGDTKNYEDIFAGRVANATIIIEDDTTFNYTYDENDVKIDSTVNSISSPTIRGSVFGGGEMASLGYWDDKYAIKSFQTVNSVPTLVSNEAENTGRGSNYGHIYSNTGSATITITGSAIIGTEDELKRYTMPPDDNSTAAERLTNVREHSSTVNPGDWTMYNDDGTVLHTCTGNVFGGSQGDIDRDYPHWVSMGRSRTATVTIGTKNVATGPQIMGCVFGGAEQGIVTEDTRVDIYSGTIGTNVNNTNSGKQFVYGDVYGAGYGCDDEKEWGVDCSIRGCEPENDSTAGSISLGIGWNPGLLGGRTFGDSRVSVLGGEIRGSVYGGGSFASLGDDKSMSANATAVQYPVHGNSWVYIGWPSDSFDPMSDSPVVGTYVTTGAIGSATIHGEVFGANNNAGTIYGNSNVHIYKTAHTPGNKLTVGGVDVVDGDYYPSGLKSLESPDNELTVDDISSSKLDGYRGSLSDDSRFALKAVYGGGNKAPHTPIADNGTTLVYVHYCNENTICDVYGGGNAADTKNNSIIIDGGRFKNIYGGGNGKGNHTDPSATDYNPGANVSGTATTEIRGGIYDYVFGGSNQLGDIGNIVLNINNNSGCEELIANGYGAGNESHGGGGTITIGCGTKFQKFFAGAQNADINSDIDVTINGGEFDEFFGGNNAGGTIYGNVTVTYHAGKINRLFGGSYLNGDITGKITVNVYSIDDLCPTNNLNYVFGGGKMAEYNPGLVNGKKINSPEVNIYKGTINNEVYGGGMGDGTANTAKVTSNPVVNIGPAYINPTSGVEYNQVVIGSPHSDVVADPVTHIKDVSNIGNVFGGGNAATTDGNTTVRVLNNSLVHGGVYGGGNAAVVTGNTDVQIGD